MHALRSADGRAPTRTVGAAALAAAALATVAVPAPEQQAVLAVLAALVGAVAWPAARRRDAGEALGWRLLVAGLAFVGVGHAAQAAAAGVPALLAQASPAAAGLVGRVLLVAGLVALLRTRRRDADLDALLDGLVVVAAVAFVGWSFGVQPLWEPGVTAAALPLAYPLADLLLVVAVVTRMAVPPHPDAADRLLLLGTLALLACDVAAGAALLGVLAPGGWVAGGLVVAYTLVAGAVRTREGAGAAADVRAPTPRMPVGRVVLLLSATVGVAAATLSVAKGLFAAAGVGVTAAVMLLLVWRLSRQARQLERTGERRFATLVQQASDVVAVLDPHGQTTYVSPSAEEVIGAPVSELTGDGLAQRAHPDDQWSIRLVFWALARSGDTAPRTLGMRVRHGDGGWRELEVSLRNLLHDPDVGGFLLIARDVTERRGLERQLRSLTFYDPLTGLVNRTLFLDRVEQALTLEAPGWHAAVLLLDVDDLRTINDALGHQVGDELLAAVGSALRSALPSAHTAARWGGDEFAVLLRQVRDRGDAVAMARRLVDVIASDSRVGRHQAGLTTTAGVALSRPGADATELVLEAEAAMRAAKAGGGGSVEAFMAGRPREAERRLQLRRDLVAALDADGAEGLQLRYQPIYQLRRGTLMAFEALARWHHPEIGPVPPTEFVALAEEVGVIGPLGRLLLRRACQQAAVWHRRGHPVGLSVNASATQLRDPGFARHVAALLEETGLPPAALAIELTETELTEDDPVVHDTLASLRSAGVAVAMDDFGSGYSSLGNLQRLPVDVVKIDRSIVSAVDQGGDAATLTHRVLQLTAELGRTTVAEGIERPAHRDLLDGYPELLGQGFALATPLTPAEATALLPRQAAAAAGGDADLPVWQRSRVDSTTAPPEPPGAPAL